MSTGTAGQGTNVTQTLVDEYNKRIAAADTPEKRAAADAWLQESLGRINIYDSKNRTYASLPEDFRNLVLDIFKSNAELARSKGLAQQELDKNTQQAITGLLTSAEQGILQAKLSVVQAQAGIYGIFGMVSTIARFFGHSQLADRIDNYIQDWNPEVDVNTAKIEARVGNMVVGEHAGHIPGTASRAVGGMSTVLPAAVEKGGNAADQGVSESAAPDVRSDAGAATGSTGPSIGGVVQSIRGLASSTGVDDNEKLRLDRAARKAAGDDGMMSPTDLRSFEESKAFKALSAKEQQAVDSAVRKSLGLALEPT